MLDLNRNTRHRFYAHKFLDFNIWWSLLNLAKKKACLDKNHDNSEKFVKIKTKLSSFIF